MAVMGIITPVLKKLKNCKISKRLEAASIEFDFYKVQCWLSRSRLNTFLYVSKHFSCDEENERHYIPLALYIRLELYFL